MANITERIDRLEKQIKDLEKEMDARWNDDRKIFKALSEKQGAQFRHLRRHELDLNRINTNKASGINKIRRKSYRYKKKKKSTRKRKY